MQLIDIADIWCKAVRTKCDFAASASLQRRIGGEFSPSGRHRPVGFYWNHHAALCSPRGTSLASCSDESLTVDCGTWLGSCVASIRQQAIGRLEIVGRVISADLGDKGGAYFLTDCQVRHGCFAAFQEAPGKSSTISIKRL